MDPNTLGVFFAVFVANFCGIPLCVYNKTIIPLALVGCEKVIANSVLPTPRWLSTLQYPKRAHGIIINCLVFYLVRPVGMLETIFLLLHPKIRGKGQEHQHDLKRFQNIPILNRLKSTSFYMYIRSMRRSLNPVLSLTSTLIVQ